MAAHTIMAEAHHVLDAEVETAVAPEAPGMFADDEALRANVQAALTVAQNMLSFRGDPQNDAEIRELAYDAVEVAWFVLDQLAEPAGIDLRLKLLLTEWSEAYIRVRPRFHLSAAA